MKKKYDIGLLLIVLFVVATGILFCCDRKESSQEDMDVLRTADTSGDDAVGPSETEAFQETGSSQNVAESGQDEIYVYVCGCVNRPDVYQLHSEARLFEAIAAAGGACDNADLDRLNLAASVQDGDRIYVPAEGETEEIAGETPASVEGADGLLNINTATAEQLQTLPGIGEAKANAIIAYREAQGSFSSIEELKQVPGIKDGVYGQIQSLIKVD